MTKKVEKSEGEKNYFSLKGEKKQKLAGFLMIVFAVLLMLSIFSYSAADKNLLIGLPDLFKVFSSDVEYLQRAANVQNWLGLFGAYLSDFGNLSNALDYVIAMTGDWVIEVAGGDYVIPLDKEILTRGLP